MTSAGYPIYVSERTTDENDALRKCGENPYRFMAWANLRWPDRGIFHVFGLRAPHFDRVTAGDLAVI